jgi:pimeloyl-ACP methyl ester carboxylesterase
MADLIVLVHPPVLGPASWRSVGDQLTRAGHHVDIPDLTGFTGGEAPYAPRLIAAFARQVAATVGRAGRPGQVVLVPHSGAGPFAAQLAAAVPGGRASVVFADAGLPSPSGPTPVVDAGFLPYLRQIAREDTVPAWSQWFPGEDPAEVYPTPEARAAVLADARPLPLSFFEETLPAAAGAPVGAAGYLLFSEGYRPEAERARERGWPVTELAGTHLHPLGAPAEVAAAIASLAARLRTATRCSRDRRGS